MMVGFLRLERPCVGKTNLYITMEMMPCTLGCGHFLIYRGVREFPTLQPQTTIRKLTPFLIHTQSAIDNHVIVLQAGKHYHDNGHSQDFLQKIWIAHIPFLVDVGKPHVYAL